MYSICVLYKTCLAWWWHISKVETRCSIKHILSCVDCYYVIINMKHDRMSSFKMCGGCHGIAHPPSQDILLSEHHNPINTEDSSCECKGELQCGVSATRDGPAASKLSATEIYVQRGVVLYEHTFVHVCLVIYPYTTTSACTWKTSEFSPEIVINKIIELAYEIQSV
jgi:hypothetical protein